MTKDKAKCKVKDCCAEYYCMGYCKKHYMQIKNHGRIKDNSVLNKTKPKAVPEPPKPPKSKGEVSISVDISSIPERTNYLKSFCKEKGCNKIHYSKGFCKRHYQQRSRLFKQGVLNAFDLLDKQDTSKRSKLKIEKCSVDGCDSNASVRKLCPKHYAQLTRKGLLPVKKNHVKSHCKVEGCTSTKYHAKGYCKTHYTKLYRLELKEREKLLSTYNSKLKEIEEKSKLEKQIEKLFRKQLRELANYAHVPDSIDNISAI